MRLAVTLAVTLLVGLGLVAAPLSAATPARSADEDLKPSQRLKNRKRKKPRSVPPPGAATPAAPEGAATPAPGFSTTVPAGVYRAEETKVKIAGDRTLQVSEDVFEFIGHVRMERRGHVLETDRILYNRKTQELTAIGNVLLSDPRYTLSCGRLVFYGPQEMGVAWESPKIVETVRGPDGEIVDRMEITAFQMTFYSADQRVEGLERVRIYRTVRRKDKLELDFKITADSMDTNLVTRMSVFKGEVQVDSPTYAVEASRLIFDATSERFTCIGNARVVGFDASGDRISSVEGNKIVHLIREKRTLVMGGVTAAVVPDKPLGHRQVDVSAVKDEAKEYEILSIPDPVKVKKGSEPARKKASQGKRN
ncbi:MAG: hypothetical protein HY815_01190 [Candidatus Riflebacteria bacterium]|nr:hypothetical protein [Candidatus Riflebacteria bacterium]